MELTDKQLTLWKQFGSEFSAPPQLCQQALNFYQQYKQIQQCTQDKIDLIMKVAYFLAQKSQVIYDREGRRLKSIAISANSVLRDHPKHEEFLYHMLTMVRSISIPPESSQLQEQISAFSRQFSSALTFLGKLRSTLKRIKVNRKTEDPQDYAQQATRLLWLLFIDCRSELHLGTDIIESTCLLGSILSFYLIEKYQQDGVFSIYFEHETQGCTLSNEPQELSTFLMNYLHIKDNHTYLGIYSNMISYSKQLGRVIDMKRMFSHQNVAKNIYLLQKIYEKKTVDGRLDQSTFLKGNTVSNQPVRVTPFGRRAPLAPKTTAALSHKILNFENLQEIHENKCLSDKKDQKVGLQFLNKLKLIPTPKATLIRATPMSEAMQNYNWLFDKSGRYPLTSQQITIINQTFQVLIQKEHNYQAKRDHCQLSGGLWKQTLERYGNLSPRALLLISVYTVCHVLNAPNHDIKIAMDYLQISEFQVWQALDQVINSFDKNMPLPLKITLLNLQTSFVSHRLWNNLNLVEQITSELKQQKNRLSRRILHQGAYTIHFLVKKLDLEEELSDTSFLIFQQSLQFSAELLHQKVLEHVVVCSLYAATKVKDYSLRFNQILSALKDVLGLATGTFQELFLVVNIDEKRRNIIDYYNEIFVPSVKGFLKQLRSSAGVESSPALMGPKVKDMVMRQATALTSPQMASYFAYSESPMLKNRCLRQLNTISNIAGNTIKRQVTYGIQDLEAKFGRFGGNNLKETRRVKH